MHITFAKDLHDQDGDVFNRGIFLFFDDTLILRLDTAQDLEGMIKNLQTIQKEILQP